MGSGHMIDARKWGESYRAGDSPSGSLPCAPRDSGVRTPTQTNTLTLSEDEVREITGYTRPAYQRRWLTERGFMFEVRRNGSPAILRTHLERRMGGKASLHDGASEPNWAAL
jgi:hypothetical protein